MKWTSDKGFGWLASFYDLIEQTGEWPTQQTITRAIFLNRNPHDAENPMAYRIIKVTSALYRVWGSVRMRDLGPWVDTWRTGAFFSGVPGVGAEECSYLTALDVEYKRLQQRHCSLGSIDVYKCFDQIIRPLLLRLIEQCSMLGLLLGNP